MKIEMTTLELAGTLYYPNAQRRPSPKTTSFSQNWADIN